MLEELKELNRDILEGKVISELKEIARELNISGISNLKKEALIEKILVALPKEIGLRTSSETHGETLKTDNGIINNL